MYEIAAYMAAMGQYERQITDPGKLDALARRKALLAVHGKYNLQGNWKPGDLWGVSGPESATDRKSTFCPAETSPPQWPNSQLSR